MNYKHIILISSTLISMQCSASHERKKIAEPTGNHSSAASMRSDHLSSEQIEAARILLALSEERGHLPKNNTVTPLMINTSDSSEVWPSDELDLSSPRNGKRKTPDQLSLPPKRQLVTARSLSAPPAIPTIAQTYMPDIATTTIPRIVRKIKDELSCSECSKPFETHYDLYMHRGKCKGPSAKTSVPKKGKKSKKIKLSDQDRLIKLYKKSFWNNLFKQHGSKICPVCLTFFDKGTKETLKKHVVGCHLKQLAPITGAQCKLCHFSAHNKYGLPDRQYLCDHIKKSHIDEVEKELRKSYPHLFDTPSADTKADKEAIPSHELIPPSVVPMPCEDTLTTFLNNSDPLYAPTSTMVTTPLSSTFPSIAPTSLSSPMPQIISHTEYTSEQLHTLGFEPEIFRAPSDSAFTESSYIYTPEVPIPVTSEVSFESQKEKFACPKCTGIYDSQRGLDSHSWQCVSSLWQDIISPNKCLWPRCSHTLKRHNINDMKRHVLKHLSDDVIENLELQCSDCDKNKKRLFKEHLLKNHPEFLLKVLLAEKTKLK